MEAFTTRYLFGEWIEGDRPLTVADVEAICRKADARRASLAAYPLAKSLAVLEAVGRKWADPEYPHRRELERLLPSATGFSPEMIRLGMEEIVSLLDPKVLEKKVRTELKGLTAPGLPLWEPSTRTQLRWSPLGVVLHVLSGNVFLVGIGSLIEGLLTGNVTILKMSSGEKLFLPRLVASLRECDPDGVVSGSVAVVDYASSQKDVLEAFKRHVDGLVVWGGEEAVRAYRDGLGAGKKLVVFGPKLSMALVTARGLDAWGPAEVADKLAWEMSVWDQNACTAPQQCYVETEDAARRLVEALPEALERWRRKLPAGPADTQVAVEIRKWRGVAEIAESRGEGLVAGATGNVDWTVILDRKTTLEPSPLHRTIRVIPFTDRRTVLKEAEAVRGYVQTVGIAAADDELGDWYRDWAAAGALKVGDLGSMGGGEIDDPHDGAYDLPQLGHFVIGRFRGTSLVDERLRALIDRARQAPFYRERLEGVTVRTTADLPKIPMLTRGQMEANMPPQGWGLSTTGSFAGGYVSRSGGSTGEPKYSLYDGHDWEQMIREAVPVFQALGMKAGDRVANFMLAGDLYGSFVSFDHVNCRLGATTFAFANQVDPDLFVRLWRQFGINVLQAIPARALKLLREAKEREPAIQVPVVVYAGTPMSRTDREWLKGEVGTRRVSSVIGANDGGQIAFQCEQLSDGLHHTVDDFNWIELVDDKGKPVPDGEPGRILITSLLKYAFPLIRYEVGDMGRFVPTRCPCGRANRVLEYLGRADDTICVGLINLSYRDVLRSLDAFPVSALQLAVREGERGDEVVLRVETHETDPGLPARMREAVVAGVTKIADGLADGTLGAVTVETHGVASLTRNLRSGKLKTLVDERS